MLYELNQTKFQRKEKKNPTIVLRKIKLVKIFGQET